MDRIAVALLVGMLACSCSPEATPPAPTNALLVLVDALRADHLGAYGYPRATSPHVDALAGEGLLFERAFAHSPSTGPSIPTLLTSLYPIQHGVYGGGAPGSAGLHQPGLLADEVTTVAEAFRAAGYRTAAFVNDAHPIPTQGLAQGFDVYDHGDHDAGEIGRRFLAWLAGEPERPFFAYLHYLDAQWPFQPEPPFAERFAPAGPYSGVFAQESWTGLREAINDGAIALGDRDREELVARHDGAVAAVDTAIGKLLGELRARGILDATFVLLTADHGEELLDHGKIGHGGTLYGEVLRVPLIVRAPGGGDGRRVETPARLLDVFPTLAAATGVPLPPGLEGRDLLSADATGAEVIAETRHERMYLAGVRDGDWSYVRTYRVGGPRAPLAPGEDPFAPARLLSRAGLEIAEELYDLASDPGETRDVAAAAAAERERLGARLDAWIERMAAAGAGRR